MAVAGSDPLEQAVVLACAWALLLRQRVGTARLRALGLGIGVLMLTATAANGLLSHTGANVVAIVPSWVPLAGGVLTVEGFVQGAAISVGLAGAVSAGSVLSLAIEPGDLLDALPRPLERTATALAAALHLVPSIAASYVAINEAQRLRGWRARSPRALADLVVPVVLSAMETSLQLAESMEARAFGSAKRSSATGEGGSRRGLVVSVACGGCLGLYFVLQLVAPVATWYPYPTLAAPSFDPAGFLAPLLLGIAGLWIPTEADTWSPGSSDWR